MRRQGILIVIFAALFALAITGYFVFIRPLTAPVEETEEAPETEEGEELDSKFRFFMFGSLERRDIASITVDNEHGGFTFENDGSGNFFIKGYDTVSFDQELFATLVNITSYTLSKTKVGSNLSDEKMEEYGLTEPKASWTVTALSGDSYTVYVGDKLLTGGGYYCQLEGRKSVYVLGTNVETAVLVPIEKYVTPVLVAGMTNDDYYLTDDFTVYHYGEKLLSMTLVPEDEQVNENALAEVIMDYPTAYYPNSSLYYGIIYDYMELVAESCEKLGASAEDMAAAGLSEPAHMITFVHNKAKYELRFSELTEDGYYYAWSNFCPNLIARCAGESFKYLEYGLIEWIDEYVFQQYITKIDTMEVKTDKVEARYELSHSFAEDGDAVVWVNANGKDLTQDEVANFRQYYKSFLALSIEDYYFDDEYCTLTEEEIKAMISDKSNAYLTFSYSTVGGEETELAFYEYSTRHSLVTVNGVGEFYVLTDLVRKVENDTVKILNGETVTAFDKN
ncbi:MAG: DUF4340 domain-containing protein [Ruminococcaceae bacterium]|nr:DUF4340 domain-containing protein [Oscillospiraceae bacterium]